MTSKIKKAPATIIKTLKKKFIAQNFDLSLIKVRKRDLSQFEILDLRGS